LEITKEDLKKYANINSVARNIRGAEDFTSEVMDYFLSGENMKGIELPFHALKNKFRLRSQELTVLSGINNSGKSLLASQFVNLACNAGYKCLHVSLEMTPKHILARAWRQAGLVAEPTMQVGLEFTRWAKGKMWIYDQYGTIDPKTLMAVLRYAKDHCDIDLVLVDSLMTMSMNSDDWNGQKQVVQALANAAKQLDVHIMLIAHARKGQSVREKLDRFSVAGSADIVNRCDNCIILSRNYDDPSSDATLSLCKARHFDGAEMDIDLRLDMASLNFYTDDQMPEKILNVPAHGGPVGELERVALNDNIHEITIRKTERAKTTAMGQVALN
tara:strand:- start:832 stop:1821 length:990 start_codon:yes stop_codon:yes gene_type:complete